MSPRRPSSWCQILLKWLVDLMPLMTMLVDKIVETVWEQEEFNQVVLRRRHLLNRPALDLQMVHFKLTSVSQESLKELTARVL